MCPDFDSAIKIAATIITLFVITGGYLIQWQSEQVWMRWIFYINALGLGFSSMMMNEFSRINMTCTGTQLIPNGPGYNNINHQVCTLPGSHAGSALVSGTEYIKTSFSYNPDDLWLNWGIMVLLIGGFLITNAWLGEYIKWGAAGRTVTFFARSSKERQQLNEQLQANKEARRRKDSQHEGAELKIDSRAVLTWEDICYDVPVASGQLRLLKNVYGYVKPGELTALMGASGAGKTTLLDVLAMRKNIGVINGQELIDGMPLSTDFQRGTSYAEQLDVLESRFTMLQNSPDVALFHSSLTLLRRHSECQGSFTLLGRITTALRSTARGEVCVCGRGYLTFGDGRYCRCHNRRSRSWPCC
jgi:ABC-type multidrug transport system fused ATPase/permease subunit